MPFPLIRIPDILSLRFLHVSHELCDIHKHGAAGLAALSYSEQEFLFRGQAIVLLNQPGPTRACDGATVARPREAC
jgi:hypothetical protein